MTAEGLRTDLPPFAAGIFRQGEGCSPPVLLGSRCEECCRVYFPRASLCPACLGETRAAELGSRGRIYTHTVVRTKPPLGLPAPYAVGYVDLDDCGLRIFALLDPQQVGRLQVGMAVRLAVAALGHDGDGRPRLRPYFTAVEAEAA